MAPSCFKILLDPASPHLPLPSAFVTMYLKNNIPKDPKIRSANGGYVWKVKIKKIDESYCFANGWSKVAKDAQLGLADFLIFELVNESTFKMKIYTPNGCEKFLTSRNHVEHKSDEHDGNDPFFVSIISKSQKSVLRLPENFVGLPGIDREGTIMMKNISGKEWRMGIRLDTSFWTEHYYLSTGWCKFRQHNKLSEGDKCVFKYIRSEKKLCLAKVTKQDSDNEGYEEKEGTSTTSAGRKRPRVEGHTSNHV